MNKSELIEKIATGTSLPKTQITTVLDTFEAEILSALKSEEEVNLQGFGIFKPVTNKAKKGRNPKTGETIQIPAKKTAKFKMSKSFLKNFV